LAERALVLMRKTLEPVNSSLVLADPVQLVSAHDQDKQAKKEGDKQHYQADN